MKVDLAKMQKKVDNVMAVFNNVIKELSTQIGELTKAIDSNNEKITTAQSENVQYSEKIKEYEALKNKVESIVK
jgi:chromosome segregation ATPase